MKKLLYLFDIDGTLISPGPAARMSLNRAFETIAGIRPDLQLTEVAGYTDPVIVRNVLRRYGIDEEIGALVNKIIDQYLSFFEASYQSSDAPFVYRDALNLLDRVEAAGHAFALLTGNVRRGAEIKLNRFSLFDRFPFGVFGDDAETRNDLPWIARERAWDVLGESFRFEDLVIVGDTPNDARVAGEYNAASIIVCRREEWRDDIIGAGATQVVTTLSDPAIKISNRNHR